MAGGNITRIIGGKNSIETEEWIVFTDNFTASAGKGSHFTADSGTNFGTPKETPPVGAYFQKGWWTDKDNKPITEAMIGEDVKFYIQMDKTKVPTGSKITFALKDWDGILNEDDTIGLYSSTIDKSTGLYLQITELITDSNGKASVSISLLKNLIPLIESDKGDEIELYFDCSYYDKSDRETERLSLPAEESQYLIVYENEVLITVFVELPHSKETGVGAKGLAGHSAMAIGEKYFDNGPDYYSPIINENEYDHDFNQDGDKKDIVFIKQDKIYDKQGNDTGKTKSVMYDDKGNQISKMDYKFAPGRPWWGEMVAARLNISAEYVRINDVLNFIKLDWYDDDTNIYGKIHTIEFYVKESQANKMVKWWEERYKHLKVYSVLPWTGEQCTTTVKTALQQIGDYNWLPDVTQTPGGLLEDLRAFKSTSKQHLGELSMITIIKNEDYDWPTP